MPFPSPDALRNPDLVDVIHRASGRPRIAPREVGGRRRLEGCVPDAFALVTYLPARLLASSGRSLYHVEFFLCSQNIWKNFSKFKPSKKSYTLLLQKFVDLHVSPQLQGGGDFTTNLSLAVLCIGIVADGENFVKIEDELKMAVF